MAVVKDKTHVVIKIDDTQYLSHEQINDLFLTLRTIEMGRLSDSKKLNKYHICNQDEPYSEKVLKAILDGEDEKLGGK